MLYLRPLNHLPQRQTLGVALCRSHQRDHHRECWNVLSLQHSLTASRKLLLRIYGPQVEHLIDREVELQILKRLARKSIGPRMLGTFTNGRFEQYFNARTLTAQDLRNPETSKQIAKRMRELHDGIDLLEEERSAGPFIWQNWDKWVQRCEEVICWLDQEISTGHQKNMTLPSEAWRKRGLVCGVAWSFFRQTVDRYRRWLGDIYGDPAAIKRDLVFAHNDVSDTLIQWTCDY